ncbi:hypothetical protein [Paracoccus beibuensis]|uniref:hypothetical protein n=1 Tax=Paracoccus beibuensis TaxID=547602 RepID=UPI002240663F|nr:hypothetical protein [Paracoccus beibuensis]
MAVAYIFLHVLPELATHQQTFSTALNTTEATAEGFVDFLSLANLVVFYGLERTIRALRKRTDRQGECGLPEAREFWLHIGPLAVCNLIIGYLLAPGGIGAGAAFRHERLRPAPGSPGPV